MERINVAIYSIFIASVDLAYVIKYREYYSICMPLYYLTSMVGLRYLGMVFDLVCLYMHKEKMKILGGYFSALTLPWGVISILDITSGKYSTSPFRDAEVVNVLVMIELLLSVFPWVVLIFHLVLWIAEKKLEPQENNAIDHIISELAKLGHQLEQQRPADVVAGPDVLPYPFGRPPYPAEVEGAP